MICSTVHNDAGQVPHKSRMRFSWQISANITTYTERIRGLTAQLQLNYPEVAEFNSLTSTDISGNLIAEVYTSRQRPHNQDFAIDKSTEVISIIAMRDI